MVKKEEKLGAFAFKSSESVRYAVGERRVRYKMMLVN